MTNFKAKVCWLSEPFAYNEKDEKIANYEQLKECFKNKVAALGGNIESDLNAFGSNQVVWLDNTYNPNADVPSSSNWGLPSPNDCLKWIKNEIHYKTANGLKVNIVRMYTSGTVDPNTL